MRLNILYKKIRKNKIINNKEYDSKTNINTSLNL